MMVMKGEYVLAAAFVAVALDFTVPKFIRQGAILKSRP